VKESGLILLQTIPNHINIDCLKRELLEVHPGIVNVHDLHVWQLAKHQTICTVHIVFLNPMVYKNNFCLSINLFNPQCTMCFSAT